MSQYPNSGSLFERKAEGRQPTRTGYIELGEDLCDYIHQEYKAGREVKLDISAWDKISAKGLEFISLSVKKPYVNPTPKPSDDIPF